MKYTLTLAAAAALASVACPATASAAEYNFAVTGDYTASWTLSDTVDLLSASSQGFDVADVAGTFPGSTAGSAYLTFFSADDNGGLTIADNDSPAILAILTGAQLYNGTYGGPTWVPVFKTGTFAMAGKGGIGSYTLTISPVASAIPEPSTWALAVLGMGLVGASLRSRRTRVSVRYA